MIQFIVALLVGVLFYELYWKRRNLPPGPTPLPFIGNLVTVQFHEPGYTAFEMWREKYGPIFTYWIGYLPFVIVSDYQTMKDTFVKDGDAYAGKFTLPEVNDVFRVETSGEQWREHRRFALHVLKDLGLSKNVMEEREMIDVNVGSVINQLLFGYRFDQEHLDEFLKLKVMIKRQFTEFCAPAAAAMFILPISRKLPYFKTLWQKFLENRDAFYGFFDRQIDAHKKDLDYDSEEATDYVEAFLKEQKRREANGDHESFSHKQLQNMCLDLWFAGMETTSNTLAWSVVYMLNFPDIQAKVQEELDREIGSSRQITTTDKNQLVYTNAVINEVQRLANLVPVNLFHQTTRDVQMGPYHLPAGTGVVAQISTVLYDKEVFPEPLTFNPSRFIDEDGTLKRIDELIPFSIGKRQCLGEGLARMELFLFFSNLLNRFELCPVDSEKPPSMEKKFGMTMKPQPFHCVAKLRHH
ncbi:unnamed protein product [Nippostrongylus brasiliensis]|uniref:Unspecific monooxygenase n=1 Tax=Nippostrongylus brasiliensis TaxID=27835 RepID=A0A0N4YD87_NIPBR|nr:unnamed protein product [Nippostrongylus brasiliensis]